MNPSDLNVALRVFRTLGASFPSLGRPGNGDEARLDLLRPDPIDPADQVTTRLLIPVRSGGAWHWARLHWRFDGDQAVLVQPGFPTIEALLADAPSAELARAAA